MSVLNSGDIVLLQFVEKNASAKDVIYLAFATYHESKSWAKSGWGIVSKDEFYKAKLYTLLDLS